MHQFPAEGVPGEQQEEREQHGKPELRQDAERRGGLLEHELLHLGRDPRRLRARRGRATRGPLRRRLIDGDLLELLCRLLDVRDRAALRAPALVERQTDLPGGVGKRGHRPLEVVAKGVDPAAKSGDHEHQDRTRAEAARQAQPLERGDHRPQRVRDENPGDDRDEERFGPAEERDDSNGRDDDDRDAGGAPLARPALRSRTRAPTARGAQRSVNRRRVCPPGREHAASRSSSRRTNGGRRSLVVQQGPCQRRGISHCRSRGAPIEERDEPSRSCNCCVRSGRSYPLRSGGVRIACGCWR